MKLFKQHVFGSMIGILSDSTSFGFLRQEVGPKSEGLSHLTTEFSCGQRNNK